MHMIRHTIHTPVMDTIPGDHIASSVEAMTPILVGEGCVRRDLPAPPGARAWWVDMAPGSTWPTVDHHDTGEAYFVLSGEVVEGDARYPAGTQVVFAPGSRHRPSTVIGARLLGFNLEADAFLGAGGDPVTLTGRLHLQQG